MSFCYGCLVYVRIAQMMFFVVIVCFMFMYSIHMLFLIIVCFMLRYIFKPVMDMWHYDSTVSTNMCHYDSTVSTDMWHYDSTVSTDMWHCDSTILQTCGIRSALFLQTWMVVFMFIAQ